MMKKGYKVFLITTFVLSLIMSTFAINNLFASIPYQIDSNLNEIMKNVEVMASEHSDQAYSSNPYDYLQDNANYQKIVALGPNALVTIKNQIEKSTQNGLREYILAIAAEEIAKVNLKGDTCNWSNSKEWLNQWKILLRNVPDEVEMITSSSQNIEAKNLQLRKLGVVAIPYILDKVATGKAEYEPVVKELLNLEKNSYEKINIAKWAQENKEKYENLRTMVQEVDQI